MGVRVTDERNVALYDSVTGWACGAVFDSTEHAEDFLRRASDEGIDPRTLAPDELAHLRERWRQDRLDDEGELMGEAPDAD